MKTADLLVYALLIFSTFNNLMGQTMPESITKTIDTIFVEYNIPHPGASVMVIKDGKIIFSKGYGYADIQNKIPIEPATNFRLASVSKQFTAMSIMMLSERGKISLDGPLKKYFPDFPAWADHIKIINLLNHTSGIWDYESLIPDEQTIPVSDHDVYTSIKEVDSLYFSPGEKFQYSNTAYVLLGLIIEKLSGLTFSDFLKENIFIPLGMNDSRTNLPDADIPKRAFGYSENEGSFTKTDQSVTSYTLGDGGIYSSVTDLYKWDQMLYNGKLLKPATLDKVFTPSSVISKESNENYGLGWYLSERKGKKCIWHNGDSRGFTNLLLRYPEEKLAIIILTNRNGADLPILQQQLEKLFIKE